MKKLVIFGTGDIAQIAYQYFTDDSDYKVIAFTVDKEFNTKEKFEGLPVVDFEDIEKSHPGAECHMFIALSYAQMNKLRQEKYHAAKQKGYILASYISSHCTYLSKFAPGDNCFIFEDNTIQPFVRIGNNVTLWSGNHIGHHSEIHDHNFISSHVVVSGHCIIESNCFLGVNATLGHRVRVGRESLLGAGVMITRDTEEKGVYVPAKSIKLDKKSDQFNL